jgi:hypothetical protein
MERNHRNHLEIFPYGVHLGGAQPSFGEPDGGITVLQRILRGRLTFTIRRNEVSGEIDGYEFEGETRFDHRLRSSPEGGNRGQRETVVPIFSAFSITLDNPENTSSRDGLSALCQSERASARRTVFSLASPASTYIRIMIP